MELSMKIIEVEQAQYLIKSLQHHPSPYIIYDKDSGVEWLNNSAQYIFNLNDDESISIEPITCLLYTSPSPRDNR